MPPLILGSTNSKLPDKIVQQIATIVIPDNTPEVKSITLRNKTEGETHSNWGKFYPADYTITVCVPTVSLKGFSTIRTYTKRIFRCDDKLQWLALVIGHEYYHAWQWTHEQDLFKEGLKEYIEVGAELYEEIAIDKWRKYMESVNALTD